MGLFSKKGKKPAARDEAEAESASSPFESATMAPGQSLTRPSAAASTNRSPPLFCGAKFDDLFDFDKGQIFEFLRSIEKKPGAFNAPKEYHKDLIRACEKIRELDKFEYRVFINKKTKTLEHVELTRNNVTLRYFSQADLLGWVLGIVGAPPPHDATPDYVNRTLYLYVRWIIALKGHALSLPTTAQATWLVTAEGAPVPEGGVALTAEHGDVGAGEGGGEAHTAMALGASATGNKIFKEVIREARFADLAARLPNLQQTYFPTLRSQKVGNCAETFPFLLLLGMQPAAHLAGQNRARGYAAAVVKLGEMTYSEHAMIMAGKPPCTNCTELLKLWHVEPRNFATPEKPVAEVLDGATE